ncbi:MAG: KTSC domain-containing protein [Prochlorothrix sp.]
MNYAKINLSNLVAVNHEDDYLELIVDRGHELETIAIPAPIEAYEGLQDLSDLVSDSPSLLPRNQALRDLGPSLTSASGLPHSVNSGLQVQPVESSMAQSIGYDADRQVLQIEFKAGATYRFEEVDGETWRQLQQSESIGKFFNQHIKGRHPSWRKRSA